MHVFAESGRVPCHPTEGRPASRAEPPTTNERCEGCHGGVTDCGVVVGGPTARHEEGCAPLLVPRRAPVTESAMLDRRDWSMTAVIVWDAGRRVRNHRGHLLIR